MALLVSLCPSDPFLGKADHVAIYFNVAGLNRLPHPYLETQVHELFMLIYGQAVEVD
jgi:hypothetical protein